MSARFAGWPEEAFDVLLHLDGFPSTEVRERHRKDRERLVRLPMIALLNDLADEDGAYADFSVWSYGKEPWWWQHQGAIVRIARKVEIGLRFSLDGLQVKGAWHYPDPVQVALFRAAVADPGSGPELQRIIAALRHRGYEVTGDTMKRMPREYPPGHDRVDLLRFRSVVAARTLDREDRLWTPEVLGWVLDTCAGLDSLLSWLAEHVAVAAEGS